MTAWQATCNYKNCQSAGKATGTYPCDRLKPLASEFVKELDARYAAKARAHQAILENSLNINAKVLTEPENLRELNDYLIAHEAPEYCQIQGDVPYEESMNNIAHLD